MIRWAKAGLLPIGKIVGAHGIRGKLKVFSYAETPDVFQSKRHALVKHKSGQLLEFSINFVDSYKGGVLLSLEEITDRSRAEELVGSELLIDKRELPEPEDGSYYWFDLIGLSVWTTENQLIGQIESIIQTGSNDVYVVNGKDGETLIPALASVILEIDLERQTMRVRLPDGL